MPIPQDQYFDPTAVGSNFGARGYANLAGADVFFYISTTNELRAKATSAAATQGLATVQILFTGVQWLAVIQQPPQGVAHLYFSTLDGVIHYARYTAANFSTPIAPVQIGISTNFTFSATLCPNSTPPVYALLVDDGTRHKLYTSVNANFAPILGSSTVFNNSLDLTVYVNQPVVAIHPLDTNIVTINCLHTVLQGSVQKVGFYVAKLPGVS
jgi:hypothetical protein